VFTARAGPGLCESLQEPRRGEGEERKRAH